VTLVLAPRLAMHDPLHRTAVIPRYFLSMVGVIPRAIRAEHPEFLSDGVPLIVVPFALGATNTGV